MGKLLGRSRRHQLACPVEQLSHRHVAPLKRKALFDKARRCALATKIFGVTGGARLHVVGPPTLGLFRRVDAVPHGALRRPLRSATASQHEDTAFKSASRDANVPVRRAWQREHEQRVAGVRSPNLRGQFRRNQRRPASAADAGGHRDVLFPVRQIRDGESLRGGRQASLPQNLAREPRRTRTCDDPSRHQTPGHRRW